MPKPLKTLAELQVYANWVGRSPVEVLELAKFYKWEQVFPGPMHASFSRVRQYFNVNPTDLTLCDKSTSAYHIQAKTASSEAKFRIAMTAVNPASMLTDPSALRDDVATTRALSDYVYYDQSGKVWFQMGPGGTIFHWKPLFGTGVVSAATAEKNGQAWCPIFKLVCPDGTGGSRECVIFNRKLSMTIGAVNQKVDVSKDIETNSVYQGSYNYAETSEKGFAAHTRLDVKSDKCIPGFLITPKHYGHNNLSMRLFEKIENIR